MEGEIEKHLHIGNEENAYELQTELKTVAGIKTNKLKIVHDNHYLLISDGCNILLLRLLAKHNFHGSFYLNSATIDGNIILCQYVSF